MWVYYTEIVNANSMTGLKKKDNPRAPHIFLVYDYSARIYIPISIHTKVIV